MVGFGDVDTGDLVCNHGIAQLVIPGVGLDIRDIFADIINRQDRQPLRVIPVVQGIEFADVGKAVDALGFVENQHHRPFANQLVKRDVVPGQGFEGKTRCPLARLRWGLGPGGQAEQ